MFLVFTRLLYSFVLINASLIAKMQCTVFVLVSFVYFLDKGVQDVFSRSSVPVISSQFLRHIS